MATEPEITKNMLIPMVIERTANGERAMDLISRLLEDRVILLMGPIDDGMAASINAQLWLLENDKPGERIDIYINSPGGSVTSGLAMYNVMKNITSPIRTICCGMAASMGAVLLSSGDERVIMPDSRVMIHQASGGYEGTTSDSVVAVEQLVLANERCAEIIAWNTGKAVSEVMKDWGSGSAGLWLGSEAALKYGIVDEIVEPVNVAGKKPQAPHGPEAVDMGMPGSARNAAQGAKSPQAKGGEVGGLS